MENTDTTNQLYREIIGVHLPWEITGVSRDETSRKIIVRIEHRSEAAIPCPVCGQATKLHDHRTRTVRYLDTCQYETLLEVHVPRVRCPIDGVNQMSIPFAEKHSRFTSRFEMAVVVWLQSGASTTAVAGNFNLSWDEVDGIMQRAVQRGLSRREKKKIEHFGIDETSFQKRHEYVTVLLDKTDDCVIDILQDRKAKTLENWLEEQGSDDLDGIKSISMDMWVPFINAVKNTVPGWEEKIAFDRFHISKYFNDGLNKVRRREHAALLKETGESPLTKTCFDWLVNSDRTDNRSSRRRSFLDVSRLHLETAKAWQIKETASTLWNYCYMGVAEKAWTKLLSWICRCRIPEMVKVGETVKKHFWGIMNAVRLKVTNGMAEAKNARIQQIKRIACGFRNRERFRYAILFHLGKLDMGFATI